MQPTPVTADFKLSVDQANDPTSAGFLDAQAAVDCRGFSGRTAFVISRRDVERFLEDIAKMRSTTSDSAQLLGGWDDAEERLRLKVTRAGLSDGFLARVRIAIAGPRAGSMESRGDGIRLPPGVHGGVPARPHSAGG